MRKSAPQYTLIKATGKNCTAVIELFSVFSRNRVQGRRTESDFSMPQGCFLFPSPHQGLFLIKAYQQIS